MVCHQLSGTGGLTHWAGSDNEDECVGITNVPSAPSACSSASTTATGPPETHPNALSDPIEEEL